MQVEIRNRRAYVVRHEAAEFETLRQALTWRKRFGYPPTETLLQFDSKAGQSYYPAGLTALLNRDLEISIETSGETTDVWEMEHESPTDNLPGIKLYKFQKLSILKCLRRRYGVVQIPTGGGKTVVMQSFLRRGLGQLFERAIVLVPSTALCDQFVERSRGLGFTDDEIGGYHSKGKKVRPITVIVDKSLSSGLERGNKTILKIVATSQAILIDETHHLKAKTWLSIAEACASYKYMLGFSGTPFENDKEITASYSDSLIWGVMGGRIMNVPHAHLQDIGLLAKLKVLMINLPGEMDSSEKDWKTVYDKHIVDNEERNQHILNQIKAFKRLGFLSLCLCQRKRHIRELMEKLASKEAIGIFGGGLGIQSGEELKLDYEQLRRDIEDGKYSETFASQVFDEGVDLPSVGVIVMGGAGKSFIKISQRTGRGLRSKKKGRNTVYLIDFIDRSHVFLYSQAKKRHKFYNSVGADIFYDHSPFYSDVVAHAKELQE